MTEPSQVVKMVMLQAMTNNLDVGDGDASITYYSGDKPLSINSDADPLLALAVLKLPKPCVKQVNIDSVELHPSQTAIATKAGVTTWARLYNAQGEAVIDLDMGVHIILDSYEIIIGSTQKLDAIFIEPE